MDGEGMGRVGEREARGRKKATSLNCSVKIWPRKKGSGMRERRGRKTGGKLFSG